MPKSLYYGPDEIRAKSTIHFTDIPVNAYSKTVQEERANFSDDELLRIYRDITILREFESMLTSIKTQKVYNNVETTYPGPAHLSVGQEAACVGQAYLMTPNDYQFGSHRSHSEILAKALSSIQKLSDDELLKIMESFLGGATLRAVEKMGKKGAFRTFDAYSSEKIGEQQYSYIWVHFIDFSEETPEWLVPKAKIEVEGKLELQIFKGNPSINCRVESLTEWIRENCANRFVPPKSSTPRKSCGSSRKRCFASLPPIRISLLRKE